MAPIIRTQAPDKYGGLRAGLQGLIGGILQQVQQDKQSADMKDISAWANSGRKGQPPSMRTQTGTKALMNQIMTPEQQARADYYKKRTQAIGQPDPINPMERMKEVRQIQNDVATGKLHPSVAERMIARLMPSGNRGAPQRNAFAQFTRQPPSKSEVQGGLLQQLLRGDTPQGMQNLQGLPPAIAQLLGGGTTVNVGQTGGLSPGQKAMEDQAGFLSKIGSVESYSPSETRQLRSTAEEVIKGVGPRKWKLGAYNYPQEKLKAAYDEYLAATNYNATTPAKRKKIDSIWDSVINRTNRTGAGYEWEGAGVKRKNVGKDEYEWDVESSGIGEQREKKYQPMNLKTPPDPRLSSAWLQLPRSQRKKILIEDQQDPNYIDDTIIPLLRKQGYNL